jgi:Family of unknown function (DUF6932)
MLPAFDENGNLPPGVHEATWVEIVERFGRTDHRRQLLSGLRAALDSLKAAGCKRAYIDGSLITNKAVPDDFDGCWDADGVVPERIDPVLLDFSGGQAAQKAKFLGELFIAEIKVFGGGKTFLEFFQQDKETGDPKGIIGIDL